MKSRTLICMTALTLFATLAISVELAAQEQQQNTQQPRYRLVVIDTLGGPQSYSYGGQARSLNNRGLAGGQADTSIPDPNYPNFNPYVASGGPYPVLEHAFNWQNGTLTDLGTLPGANNSDAGWINDRGMTVGNSTNGSIDPITGWPESAAVLWKDGQIINLGTLGGNESQADAINNRGQISGFAANAIPDSFPSPINPGLPGFGTQQRAFLWENGVMRDLGTLGTGTDSAALIMNERGQVAGISYTSTTPGPLGVPPVAPFLWENGKMLDLGSFGGTSGVTTWINNHGQVVGASNLMGDLTAHPFLWDRGVLTDIGTLGGTFGMACSINDPGEIVGISSLPGDQLFHATLWNHGAITDLGTLGSDLCSDAESINSRAQIVGGSTAQCDFAATDTRAFLWQNGGPMIDLNAFVPPGSGLTLVDASYVNDRGEILVGGFLSNGDERAGLLIPCHGDEDGCQGENPTGVTQGRPVPATQQPTTLNGRSMLDRLRARRFPSLRTLGPATGPTN